MQNHSLFAVLSVLLHSAALLHADPPSYADKSKLLVWRDDSGADHAIKTAEDWNRRRLHILQNMQLVMGPLPDDSKKVLLDVRYLDETTTPRYVQKKLTFAAATGDRVPAYLLLPRGKQEKSHKLPAVLCLHQTNGALGAKEPVGLGGNVNLHYAKHLAERGYVILAPDYPSFGEYPFDFAKSDFGSGTMKAIWNNRCAVDLLQSLDEVDGDRIGCIGHSLGGHNTMYTAVFEPRIKVMVSNCGFNSFYKYYGGNLRGWTSTRYMPKILSVYDANPAKMPFDFTEVVAAFAPRPFLAVAPVRDTNFEVSGVKDCISAAQPVYELLGASEKLAASYPACGHDFPEESRTTAYEWLDRWLRK